MQMPLAAVHHPMASLIAFAQRSVRWYLTTPEAQRVSPPSVDGAAVHGPRGIQSRSVAAMRASASEIPFELADWQVELLADARVGARGHAGHLRCAGTCRGQGMEATNREEFNAA